VRMVRSAVAEEYLRWRRVEDSVTPRFRSVLDGERWRKAAAMLGLLEDGEPAPGNRSEAMILSEFATFAHVDRGRSVPQILVESCPFVPGSDEAVLLAAFAEARYGVFEVLDVEPMVGVRLRDTWRDEELTLIDRALSQTAYEGLALGMRVLSPGGLHMGTGVAVPVRLDHTVRAIERGLAAAGKRFGWTSRCPEDGASEDEMAAIVIRAGIAAGETESLRRVRSEAPSLESAMRRPPRNAPCACGSGRKYKGCCGRERP